MRRREFLGAVVIGVVGCAGEGEEPEPGTGTGTGTGVDAGPEPGVDGCVGTSVLMHDTHAQALYFDGSLGPLTGIIRVAAVVAGVAFTLDFWHGHGGQLHRFTLDPAHLEALKAGERVYVTTTEVDGHMHTLFVDPLDEDYRVDGAPDVPVPLGC